MPRFSLCRGREDADMHHVRRLFGWGERSKLVEGAR
jgi:hypothetical protein